MKAFLRKQKNLTLWALIFISLSATALRLAKPLWKHEDLAGVITWDFTGYYAYLPATFIYNDLGHLGFFDSLNQKYNMAPMPYMFHDSPIGKKYIMYPTGVAMAFSPFFFAAHLICQITNYPPDGYSLPYRLALSIGGLFYIVMSFWSLRILLRLFFSEKTVALSMIILFFGTNLLTFGSWYPFGPHIPGIFFSALFLWASIKLHESPATKYFVIFGSTFGLLIIMRPTNTLLGLFPLLYQINASGILREKWRRLCSNIKGLIAGSALLGILVFIQLAYWRWISGSWIFFSYPGEWFDFTQPHLLQQWFSSNKGWLLYSPVFILTLLIIFRRKARQTPWFIPTFIIFGLSAYVFSSWSNWWFGGGGFGHRAYLDLYALLALPLAYQIEHLPKPKVIWKLAFFFVLGLNLVQNWQWDRRIIGVLNESPKSYRQNFLQFKGHQLNGQFRFREFEKSELDTLKKENFNTRQLAQSSFIMASNQGYRPLEINQNDRFATVIDESALNVGLPPRGAWIRTLIRFKTNNLAQAKELAWVVDCKDKSGKVTYHYDLSLLKNIQVLGEEQYLAELRSVFPIVRYPTDIVKMYLYNPLQKPMQVAILNVDVFMMEVK